LKWIKRGGANRVYNRGTGQGFSVREVIQCAQQVTNEILPVVECNRPSGDCTRLMSSVFLIKKELGWKTFRSNLNQIITDAWRCYQTGLYYK
jgi:UDP-glucose 4-epimerase